QLGDRVAVGGGPRDPVDLAQPIPDRPYPPAHRRVDRRPSGASPRGQSTAPHRSHASAAASTASRNPAAITGSYQSLHSSRASSVPVTTSPAPTVLITRAGTPGTSSLSLPRRIAPRLPRVITTLRAPAFKSASAARSTSSSPVMSRA